MSSSRWMPPPPSFCFRWFMNLIDLCLVCFASQCLAHKLQIELRQSAIRHCCMRKQQSGNAILFQSKGKKCEIVAKASS